MITLRLSVILAILLLAFGCTVLQIGGGGPAPDPEQVAKLAQAIPTYDEAQIAGNSNAIRAGSVEAYLCRRNLISSVTNDDVITVLRQKAYEAGANGLTDVSCGPGPTSETGGCMMAIACSATLVKIVETSPTNKEP